MDVKTSDVLFLWGKGFIDDAIEVVTDGPSHVALFLTSIELAEAQGMRLAGPNLVSSYLKDPRITRMEVWTDWQLTSEERLIIANKARSLFGHKYDYFLIPLELAHFELGMKLNWYHEHSNLICSTFVETCAEAAKIKWANVPNPAPVDLMWGLKQKHVLKG